MNDVIREGHPNLTKKSENIIIPANQEDIALGLKLLRFCIVSQNEDLNAKLKLRPAVGISAVQVNVLKRIFAVHFFDLNNKIVSMIVANPIIINKSKEIIYLNNGEGCLSIDRETVGITPRHKVITFEAWIYNAKANKFFYERKTLKDYAAIVFQHEYDHLDGILYIDKLYPNLPHAKPLFEQTNKANI